MIRVLIVGLLALAPGLLCAQVTLSGTVTDSDAETVVGANVYLRDTYDGASTDVDGRFSFITEEEGPATLVVSAVGFETENIVLDPLRDRHDLHVELHSARMALEAVVIAAGAFEASDRKKAVVFRPLDIVTTAGATADIAGALNTLPGTQTVGEEGKLFVRGGDAAEVRTFIDGMLVHEPYSAQVPDIPARGRFSPFLFSGTVFSTGGYSAEYGQAMSSVLLLETADLPDATRTDLSLMTIGGGLAHTQRSERGSWGLSAEYSDLTPYFLVTPNRYSWSRAPYGFQGTANARQRLGEEGMLKTYVQFSGGGAALGYPTVDDPSLFDQVRLDNGNVYANSSYSDILSDKWTLRSGLSATWNRTRTGFNALRLEDEHLAMQARTAFSYLPGDAFRLRFGAEYAYDDYRQSIREHGDSAALELGLNGSYAAAFAEADAWLGRKLVGRFGVRAEYDGLIERPNIAPRVSLAWKTGDHSQLSAAYGRYYQTPAAEQLLVTRALDFEWAEHFIANFQWTRHGRIFRAEAYYKRYEQLVSWNPEGRYQPEAYDNGGQGYARGIDLFWRDQKSIKGGDYWLSYSFLDAERNYRDFPQAAAPSFTSAHNISAVYKHWIGKLNSLVGVTYSFASPRPYDDLNTPGFMEGRTRAYQDLSLNWSYLFDLGGQRTILYVSVTNLPGFRQEFGYRFGDQPNADGHYNSVAVGPDAKRFFFIGMFIQFDHKVW